MVSHLSVAVNVTVTVPPVQSTGAVGLPLVSTGAQPPETDAVANQLLNAVVSAAWSANVHASTVVATGAVMSTGVGCVTVNVALSAMVSHLSVAVNVTVTVP